MALTRWSIRSLRRFSDLELLLNVYLGVGGILSLLFMVSAVWRTKLYLHIFSMEIVQLHGVIMRVSLEIILEAILRGLLWLPQMIYGTVIEHQSLLDWLTAAHILKDLS